MEGWRERGEGQCHDHCGLFSNLEEMHLHWRGCLLTFDREGGHWNLEACRFPKEISPFPRAVEVI